MKRRDENRQLRPEEVEALEDDEPEDAGTFARASADVLAQRRRIKIKRKSTPNDAEASFTAKPTGNPFANFSFASAAPPVAPAPNPFTGFTGLANGQAGAAAAPEKKAEEKNGISSLVPLAADKKAAASAKVTPEMEKMQRLNKSFLDWMNRKKLQHGLSIWKDGLQDYINYADSINKTGVGLNGSAGSHADKLPAFPPLASSFSLQKPADAENSASNSKPKESAAMPPPFTFAKPAEDAPKKAEASAPTFGSSTFSFSMKKPESDPVAPVAAPAAAPAFSGFSFNAASTGSAALVPPPVFSFNKPAAAPTLAAAGDSAEGGGDDEEGEPILEPEVVHRNEADDDEILHEVDCKLFRFDKEHNEWKDGGKGKFRVTKPKDSDKKRILLRNMTGKIILNALFYPKMTFSKLGKNGIRFLLSTDGSSDLKMLMIKTKPENVENTLSFLQSCVPK